MTNSAESLNPLGRALAGAGGAMALVSLALGAWGLAAVLLGPAAAHTGDASEAKPGGQAQPDPSRMAKERPELVLQVGHIEGIRAVAFSQDATRVLTGSTDRTAIVWDMDTGRQIRALLGHLGAVTSVAFSPRGKHVLTGSADRTARLWDAGNGKLIREFRHGWPVRAVAFLPDGKRLVTGCEDRTARLWDAETGKEIRAFIGHHGAVTSVAVSVDGTRLVTGAAFTGEVDRASNTAWTARLWDTGNGRLLRGFKYMTTFAMAPAGKGIQIGMHDGKALRVAPHEGPVYAVALSPDGKYLLAADTVWEAFTGREVYKLRGHDAEVGAAAFSPDGKLIVTAADTIALWDAATGKEIHNLGGRNLFRVRYSPDGKQAIGLAPGGRQAQGGAVAAAFSPDSKLVLTGHTDSTAAQVWDTASGKEVRTIHGMLAPINAVAFATDGRHLATGSADKTARVRDTVTGKVIHTLHHADFVTAVAFSPDGRLLATGSGRPTPSARTFGISLGGDNTAELWDTVSGKKRYARRHPSQVRAVAFAPEGRQLLTGEANEKPFQVLDVARHVQVPAFGDGKGKYRKGEKWTVSALAFSSDGRQALVAKGAPNFGGWLPRDVELWDRDRATPIQTFKAQALDKNRLQVLALAISPDGKQVLTASGDAIRLWDVASGEQIRALKAHDMGPDFAVEALAFSPDGTQILAGSADKSARLWNAASGAVVHLLAGHADRVTCVAFSADGKRLLTGSADGTARVWNAATGQELCRLLGFRDGTWAVVTPDNYYMAPRGALDGVTFRVAKQLFSFDQFDLKFNRPDKVLASIGLASPEMIAAYRHAYQKRLKRMNFTEDMLAGAYDLPEVAVTAGRRGATAAKTLKLKIEAADSMYLLDRLHVDVNGVPVHGRGGISLRKAAVKSWQQEIDVELSAGKNKIDVSVRNEKAAESLRETVVIQYDAPPRKADLYVLAVGVSDYQDARFRLTYADKDARDLVELLSSKRDRFAAVRVQQILNRDATRENILKAKAFLKSAGVDDLVIVFFAGHGLLDRHLDYYFATADMHFKEPARRGLPYEAIEDLLDGIAARNKLLLMDTCHSGELDREDVQLVHSEKQADETIKVRSFRGLDVDIAPRVGLDNSFQLLQSLFADLRRGTGAVVIASAGGAEYALESATWKNGVFTHALLRGLKGEADKNHDGRVQVSELRDFVEQEVRRLTHGRQTPTARRENLVVDFPLD